MDYLGLWGCYSCLGFMYECGSCGVFMRFPARHECIYTFVDAELDDYDSIGALMDVCVVVQFGCNCLSCGGGEHFWYRIKPPRRIARYDAV
jgi:hypothetical protein